MNPTYKPLLTGVLIWLVASGLLHAHSFDIPTGIDESLVTSRGGFLDDVEYILADGTTGRGKVEFVEHNGNKYVRLVNSSYDALLTKFSGKNNLITWINTFHPTNDAHILDNIYNTFSSLDNPALTRLNTALQKTGGQIHTEFGELLVKLSEGNTQVLARISGSSWDNKLPQLVNDLANAPPLKTKLLEKPELVEDWEILLRNGRTGGNNPANGLTRNPEALEALANIRKNPKLAETGTTDDILGQINGWGFGTSDAAASYAEVINDLDRLLTNMTNNNINISNFQKITDVLKSNNVSNIKGMHWVVQDLANDATTFSGKTIQLERSIANARSNGSLTSSIDVYCYNCLPPKLKIEYKHGPGSITSTKIKDQFIERDLFNADNLNQIQWRLKDTGFTPDKLKLWMKEHKNSINNYLSDTQKSNFFPDYDTNTGLVSDDDIINFVNDNYNNIFK